jgi:hypothetical protein
MNALTTRTVRTLALESIQLDVRARERAEPAVVEDYVHALAAGNVFPPVLVFEDQGTLWLVDGFHRLLAHQTSGRAGIVAEVRAGSRDEAIWEGCSVNKGHGLRRSNADKQHSATQALLHARSQRLSDRQIAVHCGVHHHTVGRIRAALVNSGQLPAKGEREARRGRSIYRIRIGGVAESNRLRAKSGASGEMRQIHAEGAEASLGLELTSVDAKAPLQPEERDDHGSQASSEQLGLARAYLEKVLVALAEAQPHVSAQADRQSASRRAIARLIHQARALQSALDVLTGAPAEAEAVLAKVAGS